MLHVKGHEICFALCALERNTREYSVHAFLIIVYKLVLGILLFFYVVFVSIKLITNHKYFMGNYIGLLVANRTLATWKV